MVSGCLGTRTHTCSTGTNDDGIQNDTVVHSRTESFSDLKSNWITSTRQKLRLHWEGFLKTQRQITIQSGGKRSLGSHAGASAPNHSAGATTRPGEHCAHTRGVPRRVLRSVNMALNQYQDTKLIFVYNHHHSRCPRGRDRNISHTQARTQAQTQSRAHTITQAHTHIHTHTFIHTHTYRHTHTHTHTHTYRHTDTHTHTHTHTHAQSHRIAHTHTHTHTQMYALELQARPRPTEAATRIWAQQCPQPGRREQRRPSSSLSTGTLPTCAQGKRGDVWSRGAFSRG